MQINAKITIKKIPNLEYAYLNFEESNRLDSTVVLHIRRIHAVNGIYREAIKQLKKKEGVIRLLHEI